MRYGGVRLCVGCASRPANRQHRTLFADLTVDAMRAIAVQRRPSTRCTAIDMLLAATPTQLAFHSPGFLAVLEGGCMLTDGRLGFVFITGEAVTLDLPQHWNPVICPGELAATGRC